MSAAQLGPEPNTARKAKAEERARIDERLRLCRKKESESETMQAAEKAEAIERILFCFCTAQPQLRPWARQGAPAAAVDIGYLSPAGCRCSAGQEDNTVLRLSPILFSSFSVLLRARSRSNSFGLWPSHFTVQETGVSFI
jgi:hypothetical protein